ncbi:integrase family protein [Glaciecola pallidula DSM 14239 = ACAM 615]|uniref:Integrase family protein n=2 Tax=Brumicola TaxID=3160924 RepID=K6YX64_9ALTE|nr:integrase family protein [Glaciecola pallidula DSM 14239 = ACAM 615]
MGGISLITAQSLANSMCLFLQWIEINNVDWHEVYAVSDSDKAKYWLPVYRYRKYLIEKVIAKQIDRDTANLYINHVRQFYEWARKQRRIEKLPFKYKTKVIKKKRKDGGLDLLFTDYGREEKGFTVTITDLLIPKKYKQKKSGDTSLSPYYQEELKLLYSSKALSKHGPKLRVDLAVQCGLRAEEIATFNAGHVVDSSLSNKPVYYITIVGKFDKERTIIVSKGLMASLWLYRNDKEHQHRLAKWQLEHGNCDDAPLFLNGSGSFMFRKSVGNVISKVRKELALIGKELKRDFHDLSSTFETNGYKVKSFQSRWGSCTPRGRVDFNWKIIMAPDRVVDYVVVHELCHLKQHDHSPQFWKLVEIIMPDFLESKECLRENGASLMV